MYVTESFRETRQHVMHQLIEDHPLATFVSLANGEIEVNHFPMFLDPATGAFGALAGHVPKANPLWRELESSAAVTVVFHGPSAYVSPGWYPSKRAHGKVVPTWNYAVVHAEGVARLQHDTEWLMDHLKQMVEKHEAAQPVPWSVGDAPEDFTGRMLEQIVGVEVTITELTGKWKVSQNRPRADVLGVLDGLGAGGGDSKEAMTDLVAARLDGVR